LNKLENEKCKRLKIIEKSSVGLLLHALICSVTWRLKFINLNRKLTLLSCVLSKLSLILLHGYIALVPSMYFLLSLYFPVLMIHLMHFISCIYQEKEDLITELRKELRVSDDEHRELLTRVNSDEIIHCIRFGNYLNSCNSSEEHYFWPFFCFFYNVM